MARTDDEIKNAIVAMRNFQAESQRQNDEDCFLQAGIAIAILEWVGGIDSTFARVLAAFKVIDEEETEGRGKGSVQ